MSATWTFTLKINGKTFTYEVTANNEVEAERKALEFYHALNLPEETEEE